MLHQIEILKIQYLTRVMSGIAKLTSMWIDLYEKSHQFQIEYDWLASRPTARPTDCSLDRLKRINARVSLFLHVLVF